MRIARERQRQRPHISAIQRARRQHRRGACFDLIQIFNDRERLGEHRAVVLDKRGHQPSRIDRQIFFVAVLTFEQMHADVIPLQALQIQSNTNPIRGGRAVVVVEFHGSRTRLLKRLNPGLRAAQNQRVNVVRALIRVHHFKVHHVAHHAVFIANAIATEHVARNARDV